MHKAGAMQYGTGCMLMRKNKNPGKNPETKNPY
jgi:hypothetical protein